MTCSCVWNGDQVQEMCLPHRIAAGHLVEAERQRIMADVERIFVEEMPRRSTGWRRRAFCQVRAAIVLGCTPSMANARLSGRALKVVEWLWSKHKISGDEDIRNYLLSGHPLPLGIGLGTKRELRRVFNAPANRRGRPKANHEKGDQSHESL